jgi:hypothetical protein
MSLNKLKAPVSEQSFINLFYFLQESALDKLAKVDQKCCYCIASYANLIGIMADGA